MEKSSSAIGELLFGGVIAVVATVYMASGGWDVFDVALSLMFLATGIHWVSNHPDCLSRWGGRVLLAFMFAVVSTALIVAVCANVAIVLRCSWLARVDYSSFRLVSEALQETGIAKDQAVAAQAKAQFGIYVLSFAVWLVAGWLAKDRLTTPCT